MLKKAMAHMQLLYDQQPVYRHFIELLVQQIGDLGLTPTQAFDAIEFACILYAQRKKVERSWRTKIICQFFGPQFVEEQDYKRFVLGEFDPIVEASDVELRTFEFKVALPVSCYNGDFGRCSAAEGDALALAFAELAKRGIGDTTTYESVTIRFLEFDSGNPEHASGYFMVTVTSDAERAVQWRSMLGEANDKNKDEGKAEAEEAKA